jgi:opacity protein-like surface antigen
MKRLALPFVLIAASSGFLLFSAGTASAQSTPFYLKGDLGGNLTQDLDLREFFGPVAPGSKVKLDPGVRAGITGGYKFCDFFAGEAEVGFFGNRIDSITGATRVHDARFANVPVMVNAKLQYPNRSPLTPYIGAGIGFSEAIIDVDQITIGGTTLHGNTSDTVFAYQAFAGLRYTLNERMGLSVEYHYFAADSPKWQADFSFGTPSDTMSFGPARTHALSVAFDFRF